MPVARTVEELGLRLGETSETYLDVNPKAFLDRCKVFPCHLQPKKQFYALFDFLTRCRQHFDMNDCMLMYIGAAPGDSIPIALSYFPGLLTYLYDPLAINVKSSENIKIYTGAKGRFTDRTAERLRDRCQRMGRKILLIFSDIRSGNDEVLVARDMRMQQKWVKLCTPEGVCLRFQPRYDVFRFSYLAGDLCLQVNAPPRSTESRLIAFATEGMYPSEIYDVDALDRLFHAYNIKIRTSASDKKVIKLIESTNIGIRGDYEAELELEMIKSYIKGVGDKNRGLMALFVEINKQLSAVTRIPFEKCRDITKQIFVRKHLRTNQTKLDQPSRVATR